MGILFVEPARNGTEGNHLLVNLQPTSSLINNYKTMASAQLQSMGFDKSSVKTALAMNDGNMDAALSMLLQQSQQQGQQQQQQQQQQPSTISLVDDDNDGGPMTTETFRAHIVAAQRLQQGFNGEEDDVDVYDDGATGEASSSGGTRNPLAAARSVFDYLCGAGGDTIDRLYGKGTDLDPECVSVSGSAPMPHRSGHSVTWTVRAVLRSLPPLAQQYCLRLMVSGGMGG